jgi:hypothetical protein
VSFEYLVFRSLYSLDNMVAMGPSKKIHSIIIPNSSNTIAINNNCVRNDVGMRWSNSNCLGILELNNSQQFNPQRNRINPVNILFVQRYFRKGFPLLKTTAVMIYSKFPMRKVEVFSMHSTLSSNLSLLALSIELGTNQELYNN